MTAAIDPDADPFWAALREGALRLPFSPATGRFQFPPLERCRHTGEPLEWREVAPRGRVFSFIVQHRPTIAAAASLVPYAIALIELDDAPGIRLPMRIADSDGSDVRIDAAVAISIAPGLDGQTPVPLARLVR